MKTSLVATLASGRGRSAWVLPLLLGAVSQAACAGSTGLRAGTSPGEAFGDAAAEARRNDSTVVLDPEDIVDAEDRTAADRDIDERRHPVEFLEFLAIAPGDHVADLGAGACYTTELLARAVGPDGVVYAQNDALTIEKYVKDSWPARLQRDVMKNVERMDLEFDAPFVPEAKDLALVTLMFSYHDVIAAEGDRAQLNLAVLRALEPGGRYVVADHRAAEGAGLEAASQLHRIEEAIVRSEIEAAGFEFVRKGSFLSSTSDDPSKPSFAVGFATDRFLLEFRKPLD